MKVFNNVTDIVRDDMASTMKKGSKVAIAAACFSMYAYNELKKQLENVDELRFIFTSPTFVTEKASKQRREFYIPRIGRERSLYGTEFEIKLRNEMTQKAIAKECAEWIRRKATFRSNTTGEAMAGFMTVESKEEKVAYMPLNGFTTVDIGCDRGNNAYNMVNRMESPFTEQYMQIFDNIWNDKEKLQDVTDIVIENISSAYNENSPEFIYFMTLYHVFSEFLDDISEDVLPNEATGFKQSKIWNMLYDFQKDAVLAIINKLEKYNGCILADSVGLGKTFTALAVVKYYENRNKSVLVLCPKKLAENWNTYKDNYVNNPIATDRLNYDVLFHTDLSRNGGVSNGLDLDRLNWGNYDLVVIDESHNFRNGAGTHANTVENRYVASLFAVNYELELKDISTTEVYPDNKIVLDALVFLEQEGFIYSYEKSADPFSLSQTYYSVGMQPLFDYLIAKKVLDSLDKETDKDVDYSEGVLQMLSILLLEEKDELIGNYSEHLTASEDTLFRVQCHGFANASISAVEKYSVHIEKAMLTSPEIFRQIFQFIILPVCKNSNHPLGGRLLNHFLRGFGKPAERDVWWSIPAYLCSTYENDWCCYTEINFVEIEVNLEELDQTYTGMPLALAWRLSTVRESEKRKVRVALTQWGIQHEDEFIKLLKVMLDVNDMQIVPCYRKLFVPPYYL